MVSAMSVQASSDDPSDSIAEVALESPRPASSGERIHLLDSLRGFALLGIFLANLGAFSGWVFLSPEQKEALGSFGGPFGRDFLHLALIDGKFYTIFSLLFGIGFAVQMERLRERGVAFNRLYARRLFGLLLIGVIHQCLIWDGDILTLYALCGFLLLAFRDWPTQRLLKTGVILIVLPVPGYLLFWMAGWSSPGAVLQDLGYAFWQYQVGEAVTDADALDQMRRGGADGYFDWVLSGPLFRWSYLLDSWRLPKVIGTFMLGACAGRAILAGTLLSDRRMLRRICTLGFTVGVPANLVLAWLGGLPFMEMSETGFIATVLYAVGVTPLGLAYAAGFVLLWGRAKRWLIAFSPAGRLALTNYLMQSILGIVIFYGVGFGLAGQVGPAVWTTLGVALFAGQLILSGLWLHFFRFGPIEWLWRCATYGRWFSIRPPANNTGSASAPEKIE